MPAFRNVFLIFTLIALAEVMLFIEIGERIGLLWTIVSVIFTAALGVSLLRVEGFDTLRRVQAKAQQGEIPAVELVEGIMLLVAGALLLTPGFLTDGFGFLLLMKPTRRAFATTLANRGLLQGVSWTMSQSGFGTQQQWHEQQRPPEQAKDPFAKKPPHHTHSPEVIDGEYERKD